MLVASSYKKIICYHNNLKNPYRYPNRQMYVFKLRNKNHTLLRFIFLWILSKLTIITRTSVDVTMVSLMLTLNTFDCSILYINLVFLFKRICISGKFRLVFSRFLDLHGNLGNVKGKPTRKICFSRGKKRLAVFMYQG